MVSMASVVVVSVDSAPFFICHSVSLFVDNSIFLEVVNTQQDCLHWSQPVKSEFAPVGNDYFLQS